MIALALAALLLLVAPTAAQAGIVTRTNELVTYQGGSDVAEAVEVGYESGMAYVESAQGVQSDDCTVTPPTRADCAPASAFMVLLLGGEDTISAGTSTAHMWLEAHGGGGGDGLSGTALDDRLFGDGGRDTIDGRAGNDLIEGGEDVDSLDGDGGNDTITGGSADDRIEAGPGDDIIDSRDGRYDSIDCGEGNDTVYGDRGDFTAGCEIAPDADGDGYNADVDCAPLDPAIHPGAGEVPGNPVDEDCKAGPLYLRVTSPVNYFGRAVRRPAGVRFTSFTVSDLQAGDRVELRCKGGRRRGCAFSVKRYTARTGRPRLNVLKVFKKRRLRPGATVEVRVLRATWIGKVVRLRVGRRGRIKQTTSCLFVGETAARRCS